MSENTAELHNVHSLLEQIASCNADALIKGSHLGSLNFEDGRLCIEEAIKFSKDFIGLDSLNSLSASQLEYIKGHILPVSNIFSVIRNFGLDRHPGQNLKGVIAELVKNLEIHWKDAFLYLAPLCAYLMLKDKGINTLSSELRSVVDDAKSYANANKQTIAKDYEEARKSVQLAHDLAAQTGVAVFSERFRDISAEHGAAATKWLSFTLILVVLTVVVAGGLLYLPFPATTSDDKQFVLVQSIVSRIAVISIIYYAAIWAGRNYRTHRHLATLNNHRQASLGAFEAFVKAARDEETKNAVLLEATRCIFNAGATGYLPSGDDDNPNSRIIEILKTVGSASSSKGV